MLSNLLDGTLWQHQIFAGAVASDLLDYLARDAYFCGLSQRYDSRILQLFRVSSGQLYLEAQKEGNKVDSSPTCLSVQCSVLALLVILLSLNLVNLVLKPVLLLYHLIDVILHLLLITCCQIQVFN